MDFDTEFKSFNVASYSLANKPDEFNCYQNKMQILNNFFYDYFIDVFIKLNMENKILIRNKKI